MTIFQPKNTDVSDNFALKKSNAKYLENKILLILNENMTENVLKSL